MIVDHFRNQALYRGLHPRIGRAFDYLAVFDPLVQDGNVELEGKNLVAMIQTYQTREPANKKMESHRRYVDLQYIVSGKETMFYRPTESLIIKEPYDEGRDVMFYQDADDQPLILQPGSFAILFQHDGHKPGCVFQGVQTVRKIVFKISL